MDQDNQVSAPAEASVLATKSWTAYVGIGIIGFVLLLGFTPAAFTASIGFGLLVLVISSAFVAYKVLMIKSYQLYMDDSGVWCFSGIFPWSKGVRGVKWRDLDEAVYFQGMSSWLFKSYSIRIGHRFTKSSEIILTHMARGHEASMQINGQHQELARNNQLR
jgi:hypothetical protein